MINKTGIGYDIHRLVKGRKLILGGIEIPYSKGLLGHSDADVLLHAICDALLGAAGIGDIGEHFPDTDIKYKNICSVELLSKVAALVKQKGFVINNLDTVIILEKPKLISYKAEIKKKVSSILRIKEDSVSIKAKTNEGLDAIGRNEAIASYAVVTLAKRVRK